MKKRIILFIACIFASFSMANPIAPEKGTPQDKPDPVLSAEKLQIIKDATPDKLFVKASKKKVLVFSKTNTFRHKDGIVGGNAMFKFLGEKTKAFDFTFTESTEIFESFEKLNAFDCIVFNNTTGMFFAEPQNKIKEMNEEEKNKMKERDLLCRKNLLKFIASGKGALGIHAASDAYRGAGGDFSDMRELFGGEFDGHPWGWNNKVMSLVEDKSSPLVKGLWPSGEFEVYDEIYQMGKSYDREKCRVILRMDVDRSPLGTDKQKGMVKRLDGDYALSWVSKYGKGRYFYCALGHNKEIFMMPAMNEFYLRGLQYACGDLKIDETPSGKASAPTVSKEFKQLAEDALAGKYKDSKKK